ncbi:MAG: TrkH family potassium uptake protein [Oscillospiraceae bacterium]|nr:TrkH family potassium uptake protein [Oscillospiraceae bacterium]
MNYRMIARIVGMVMLCLAGLLVLPLITGLYYGEDVTHFVISIAVALAAAGLLWRFKPKSTVLFTRDGYAAVVLAWMSMALLGALPYYLGGDIPRFGDAWFESMSGLTTTGATILNDIEGMSRGCMFWRLFSQWIGGMGVLVFMMAVMPMSGAYSMHIMRAEFPGPNVGKLVPRVKETARMLYLIYLGLTALETVLLLLGGMDFYEALLHAFATAGTGGFSTQAESLAAYDSLYIEMVASVFALLFSTNFHIFFLLLAGRSAHAFRNEEFRWYLGIVTAATVTIALNILPLYDNIFQALRHAFFNTSMVITTSSFNTVDYTVWPQYARFALVLLMMSGACAGSTCGGIKLSRVIMLFKATRLELRRMVHPRTVSRVEMDGKRVAAETVRAVQNFFILYVLIILICTMLLSWGGRDTATNLTASIACLSNIGPGMGLIGPMGNYNVFSMPAKLLLTLVMLMGRLELYPLLAMLTPGMWKK